MHADLGRQALEPSDFDGGEIIGCAAICYAESEKAAHGRGV